MATGWRWEDATAAILLHLGYLLLAAVLTYEFARRYTPGAAPWLAVALLVTMPTVIWLGSTANTDLAIMLFVALALYALLRYVDTSRRQWLLLAALNLGFALSTKHLALFALALFCPGLLLALRSRGAGWRQAFLAALVLGSAQPAGGAALVPAQLPGERQPGVRNDVHDLRRAAGALERAGTGSTAGFPPPVWPAAYACQPAAAALGYDDPCRGLWGYVGSLVPDPPADAESCAAGVASGRGLPPSLCSGSCSGFRR